MPIQGVSFGRVTAVTGSQKKIRRLNNKIQPRVNRGVAWVKDVTGKYQYSSSDGAIGRAVRNGDSASIYVTGEDVRKIANKEKGWNTLDAILAQMSQYIDLNKENVSNAFELIV